MKRACSRSNRRARGLGDRADLLPLLAALLPALLTACGDNNGGVRDAGPDGGSLADAHVIIPVDAGLGVDAGPKPTLDTVTPPSGPETGGTRVTLRGTSFVEPASVSFGDQPATSVVVLDEVSIAATTPPGAPGSVTVRVTTPGGTAELPDGFEYHRELLILAVAPARLPDVGGVMVTIIGKGFDEHTLVLLDRRPLAGAELVDAEHIRGYAPSLEPGRPEIRALAPDAEARRSDLVVVYGTPVVSAVAPGFGPLAGGQTIELDGSGFLGTTRVLVGGRPAEGLVIDSDQRLHVTAPRLVSGSYDVVVENQDTSGTLRGGYISFDPNRTTLTEPRVTPPRAQVGDLVTLVGSGYDAGSTVAIGGAPARVVARTVPNTITIEVPAGLPPGPIDASVSTRGTVVQTPSALTILVPITVASVTPATGPVAGGTAVRVVGSGFVSGVRVKIGDVELTDVTRVSDTELTGTTLAGSHGPADVVVWSEDVRGHRAGAFAFVEPFEIVRMEPSEGSIAGNTYVSVFGRGLDGPVSARFGVGAGVGAHLENGAVLAVRTASASTGRVDVAVTTARGAKTFGRAYTFYDPKLVTGGAWGGPIDGSVNVAVLDMSTGDGVPGATIQLGYDADPRYRAVTDANGLATISSPEIRGPYTVTAGQNGWEFVTFTELDARNLTMFSNKYPASMGPDDPVSPCPQGGAAPVVRGHVYRFKSSLDPVTHPGWTAIARITYSQRDVFTPNPPMPAEQEAIVSADGQEFEIVVMRAGTVAVYATLYDFNPTTQEAIPRKMGIVRNVPAAPGTTTEPVDISLDIELTQSITVHLDDPPVQDPGPTTNAVFPYLNLQSDGVIPFSPTSVGASDVTLTNLPELAASQFFYMGGSFTDNGGGSLGAPYSITLRESGRPFSEGLDLGPFVKMPTNVAPKPGEVIRHGAFSWDEGGVTPDITMIVAVDVASVGGCCCTDLNGNGQCEAIEPQNCAAAPQQFNRWSVFGQGGRERYVMPLMPSGLNAFASPNLYFWIVEQSLAPRFNYGEFIYNEFSQYFWTSWSIWYSQFTSKEETP